MNRKLVGYSVLAAVTMVGAVSGVVIERSIAASMSVERTDARVADIAESLEPLHDGFAERLDQARQRAERLGQHRLDLRPDCAEMGSVQLVGQVIWSVAPGCDGTSRLADLDGDGVCDGKLILAGTDYFEGVAPCRDLGIDRPFEGALALDIAERLPPSAARLDLDADGGEHAPPDLR